MSVCAVVGGQFGSEGKGLIVGRIAKEYDAHVRAGAANAGHTVYTRNPLGHPGEPSEDTPAFDKHVMQQIPCAAYANPRADLYIGPGALISPGIFEDELTLLFRWRKEHGLAPPTVHVDPRAHVIMPNQISRESESDLAKRIGSTSAIAREGIGVAQADRVNRKKFCMTADNYSLDEMSGVYLDDVPWFLAMNESVLLEGTQGAGLSLTTGPFPFVTSRNTTSAGLAADCGVAPHRLNRVILVVRTFPIRVAGNSGPFALGSKEISWNEINVNPESERTTVTGKIRRVATFSMGQVVEAAYLNGATEIALTFCDYLDPELSGASYDAPEAKGSVGQLVDDIEGATGVPVRWLGTGPWSTIHLRDSE